MAKARYRQHWLRAFTRTWTAEGATSAVARFRPNMRAVVEWLNDAWMNLPVRPIQRCWWHTGCLPRVWALSLPHVKAGPRNSGGTVVDGADGTEIGLDEEVNDVGLLIDRLCLGPSAMSAEAFVGIDDNQPTCVEPGEDPLAREPVSRDAAVMWEAPANMQQVYDDSNPASREARHTARAACEMLIGYALATCIMPRDLCALFDIRNPIIVAQTPRRDGRVLPVWMQVPTPDWVAQTARRQELIDAGAPAVMSGYLAAVVWMRL
ncbi:unnamed protein product [Closterium sp. Yama58-4]|nr:unnamed protein product [Closterium sp. Yama58-4]